MANLINPEHRKGTITDSYVSWNENLTTGKKSGGIAIEVEFYDGSRMQRLYSLTESAAPYTVKTLRGLGWAGQSFNDFNKGPQLVGMAVECTIADATDKDGNVRKDKEGNPYREIAFINAPRGYRRASAEEAKSVAHHFDKFLAPESSQPHGFTPDEDDGLPF